MVSGEKGHGKARLIRAREQGDFAAPETGAGEGDFLTPGLRVSAFDPGELLHEADGDVGCFC